MKIAIHYRVNRETVRRYVPTDEADALHVVTDLVGKLYREAECGNVSGIEMIRINADTVED